MNIENIRDLGETPIPGEKPTGQDVSYEPNFEALTDEIAKLSSPTAEGVIDWRRVTELGVTILRDESKNLVVACYLNVAMLYTDDLKGFAVGVHVLRNVLESWWDSMYPPKKRKKGRINILNWWDDKLRQLLSERETETWPSEQRKQLLDDLDGIDTLLADKLEDGPLLRSLRDMVSRLLNEEVEVAEEIPQPEEPVEETETGNDEPSVPEAQIAEPQEKASEPKKEPPQNKNKKALPPKPSPTPVAIPEGEDGDEDIYLRQGMELLGRAASHVFQVDSSRILPYQLNRLVAWSEIDALPPNTDGVTMVPPPNEQIVSLLETMFQAENWEDLLSAAESRVREHLFWLDLSYYSARALNGLGHALAAQAVENETRLHILRLKGIESLSFRENLPFASQETKDWLVAVPAAQGKMPPNSKTVAAGDENQEHGVAQDVEEAARLCAGSGIQAGLSWLAGQKKIAGSPRRQFMYDVGLCQLLFKAKHTDMALSFAERLLMLIDRHDLEKWEPELAAQGLVAACRCLLRQPNDEKTTAQQKKQIVDRLSLLAPEQMLSLI